MSMGNLDRAAPNLVPMLDMVLQLVMFFMLCANFIQEDLDATIKLPSAIQAKPLDKSEDYVIYINIDKTGRANLGKGQEVPNPGAMRAELRRRFEFDQARVEKLKAAGKPGRLSLIVVRAHEDCRFKQVNDYLNACRQAGYADVQLRAVVRPPSAK